MRWSATLLENVLLHVSYRRQLWDTEFLKHLEVNVALDIHRMPFFFRNREKHGILNLFKHFKIIQCSQSLYMKWQVVKKVLVLCTENLDFQHSPDFQRAPIACPISRNWGTSGKKIP